MPEPYVHYLSAVLRNCTELEGEPLSVLDAIADAIRLTKLHELGSDNENPKRAVLLLKESHTALYTWPEKGLAFLDIDTCNPESDLQAGLRLACKRLGAKCADVREWIPDKLELEYRLERTEGGYRIVWTR